MSATAPARPHLRWRRRTGLVVPLAMLAIGVTLAIGTVTMVVPSTAASPGPQVFPGLIAVAIVILAVLLAVDIVRHPEPQYTRIQATAAGIDDGRTETVSTVGAAGLDDLAPDGDENTPLRPRSNVRAVIGTIATLVVFVIALEPVGWLLSASLLFWGIARFLGSRRPLADMFIALAMAAAVQLAFSAGLGLHLPPGILEGSLSWIR